MSKPADGKRPTHRESMAAALLAAHRDMRDDAAPTWGAALLDIQKDEGKFYPQYLRMAQAALDHVSYLRPATGEPFPAANAADGRPLSPQERVELTAATLLHADREALGIEGFTFADALAYMQKAKGDHVRYKAMAKAVLAFSPPVAASVARPAGEPAARRPARVSTLLQAMVEQHKRHGFMPATHLLAMLADVDERLDRLERNAGLENMEERARDAR